MQAVTLCAKTALERIREDETAFPSFLQVEPVDKKKT